ncbi:site-specific DNA-methyltransferase [Tenacibaculum haliotis]|uniref:site-specific DNA-methyltransferase n=1 Tax=Tenacibaculum haliotis TaxID=1888914 RepID=UPI0021AFACEB|nr:site-specific DNA-methyltransferase [Tenacibaculum haliotis]MCT4697580.1 site-specific DNA-methyltransferase [Tenacibaculum haliotis]
MNTDKLDLSSPDLVNQNIEKIATLFPNCVTETAGGKAIDFDLLKQELNHDVVEGAKERYRLEWPGKKEAIVTANLPTTKTLRPVRKDSVNFDTTENMYIEGDNLEVLKILQESYLGKIKMIYIDPPYNTGKDFVYKDNFTQDSTEFKEETDQIDEYGNRLVANPDTAGRYHSDWLSMMYPRLKLARNLLTEDGVIFMSIDDNEVHNLRKIGDEIFGENNFVANLVWLNKEGGGSSDSKLFRVKREFIICFSKNKDNIEINGNEISNRERYKSKDAHLKIRGPYYLQKLGMGSIQYSESLDYPITTPDNTEVYPKDNNKGKKACWRWSKGKFEWGLKNDFIEIKKDSNNVWTVYTKQYLKCDNEGNEIIRTQRPFSFIEQYSSTQASKYLDRIGLKNYFDYTKPYDLIEYLIKRISLKNEIVLDFFSGSATTSDSIMRLNAEDGANRKFIMAQLPETTDEKSEAFKAGYKNICEIGKERIRRAAVKIKEETNADIDYGFKVFKVASSNMQDVYYKPKEYNQGQLEVFADNIKEDRTAEDLLTQILLDWGLPLTLKTQKDTVLGKEVFIVDTNYLLACFDNELDEAFAKEIAKHQPLRFVCKDSSFKNDTAKENVKQLLKQLSPNTEMKVI